MKARRLDQHLVYSEHWLSDPEDVAWLAYSYKHGSGTSETDPQRLIQSALEESGYGAYGHVLHAAEPLLVAFLRDYAA